MAAFVEQRRHVSSSQSGGSLLAQQQRVHSSSRQAAHGAQGHSVHVTNGSRMAGRAVAFSSAAAPGAGAAAEGALPREGSSGSSDVPPRLQQQEQCSEGAAGEGEGGAIEVVVETNSQ